MKLDQLMQANLRVLLVGPPGIGKTARVLAACKASGRRLILRRASLSERVDFGGVFVPDLANGVTRALPLELLRDLRETKEPTLLFLDDLGQAPMDVQAALMLLFDSADGVSDSVLIWGATNRPGDKAGVSALCEPLRSRFHLAFSIATPDSADKADGPVQLGDWKSEVDSWCEWALATYPACPEIVAWHRSPQLGASHTVGPVLYGWKPSADPALRMPDFRAWETVCRLWSAGQRGLSAVAGAIGKGQASAFLAFAELADKLPSVEQIWIDPEHAPIPGEPSALCLTAVRLASAVEKNTVTPFVKYIERLPILFAALATRDAFRRLNSVLASNPAWQRWLVAHKELFTSAE